MQRREGMASSPRRIGHPKRSQVGIFVELGHVENVADHGRTESPMR